MKTSSRSPISRAAVQAAFALLLFCSAAPRTFAVTFDLEDQVATSGFSNPGAYTSLVLNNSGLTMTITRESGARFDVVDATVANWPPSFQTRALDPFFDTSASAFVANFSQTLSGFSLEFGDFDGDGDLLTLNAFSGLNGTGALLGTVSIFWNDDFGAGDPAAVAALTGLSGIQSVTFIGGSSGFPNSLYYDNFIATLDAQGMPEGGNGLMLLGLGLGAVLGIRYFIPLRRLVRA